MAGVKKKKTQPDTFSDSESVEIDRDGNVEAHGAGVDENISDSPLPAEHLSDEPETDVRSQHATTSNRGGLFPLVAGGVIAGGLGFLLAQYFGNDRWPFDNQSSAVEVLEGKFEAQALEIAALQDKILQLEPAISTKAQIEDLEHITGRLEATEGSNRKISETLTGINQRLTDIENRPIPDVGATEQAVEVYSKELAAMRKMFEEELQRIESAQGQAVEASAAAAKVARDGAIQGAASELQAAINSGEPFSSPLEKLEEAGLVVSRDLKELAPDGIPSLQMLGQSFPPAARLALAAALKEQASEGKASGVATFLRNQLGVRSLVPREGDDPDAILSRAEAAVNTGNIENAISEIESLPSVAAQEMHVWVVQARRRLDVEKMVTALLASAEG